MFYSPVNQLNPAKNIDFLPKTRKIHNMEKPEIKHISDFLSDIYEGICEDDGPTAMQLYLTELYKLLIDETFRTKDHRQKVILASLEYKARRCKQMIEVPKEDRDRPRYKKSDQPTYGPYFGAGKDRDPGSFFSGLIDDVRIHPVR